MSSVALAASPFAKGADVGWLTQMEASGVQFFDASGTQQDCLQILRGLGMNSIRLRVWVNPAGGWNGQADVVNKAVRAQNLGFRIMIDFHYSDTWADPGHQTKPAAWSSHGISQLNADVSAHTTTVLNALKSAGVTPEWVQVGNETNDGMLWEDGRASTAMANFAGLITSGYNAVKSVFPNAKVIVHISNGFDNSLFRWMFDGLTANGAKFDVIGLSLYPTTANWAALNSQCLANMNDLVARYGKEVMVSEVGMDVNSAATAKSFLADIISKTKSVSGGNGLGVFYWEPEAYNNWQGYTLGAFASNGRPTVALDAFKPAPSADFNGDGQADLLWSNTATGDRAIWFLNGTALGSFGYLAGIPTDWQIAGTADFNGDGQTDILWENITTGDRSIWLMNGPTISSFSYLAYVDPVWHIAAIGDFNGDGWPDLLWENTATGDRAIWFLNGTALGSFGYLAGIPTDWHMVGAADFNGDGQTDILWENITTGDRSIWLMSGPTISSFVYLANVSPVWHIAMVADFNGDGQPDLLWENTVTGDRAIWLMNGTTVSSKPYLAHVDPLWRIAP